MSQKEVVWYHKKLQEFAKLPIQIVETKEQGYKVNKHGFLQTFPDWKPFIEHFEKHENLAILKKIVHFCKDYYLDYQESEAGETPLHFACKTGNLDMVKTCLPFSINFNSTDIQNMTPLHFACENGHYEIVKLLLDHATKKSIDVNATNRFKWTPLHIASIEGHVEVVNSLLDKADELEIKVNATDVSGHTAFDLAEDRQHKEIVLAFQALNNKHPIF